MQSKKKLLFYWTGWFFLINSILFWGIGLRYLGWAAPVDGDVINGFYQGIVWCYLILTWMGHFALLAFIPAIFVVGMILLIPQRQLIFISASVCAAITLSLLILDSSVFSQFHYHLNGILLEMALSEGRDQLFAISSRELFLFGSLFILIVLLEYFAGTLLWKKFILQNKNKHGRLIATTLSTSLLFSYLLFLLSMTSPTDYAVIAQQSQVFPLYNNFLAAWLPMKNSLHALETAGRTHIVQPTQPAQPLHYPLSPLQCQAPKTPKNIVFIVIDAWRADMLDPNVVPSIHAFSTLASRFDQHISGGNATAPGIFSLFYGLPHSYWSSMLKENQGPVFIHTLLKENYQMGIFSSAALFLPAFDHTVFAEVPQLKLRTAGKNALERDRTITGEFQQFITERKKDHRPFFSFLFYDSAHSYCDIPTLSTPFHPVISSCNRLTRNNATDPLPYLNRYKNALRFIDAQVKEVLHTLQSQNMLQNTVVVITSDHSQEFNDNRQGYWEHAGNFTAAQTHVPLIIYWPEKKAQRVLHPTSHYDIAPTLMTELFHCKNSLADYSLGKLLSSPPANQYVLIGSYIDYGIVEKDRITTIYPTGNFTIEDVHAKIIPGAKLHVPVVEAVFSDMMKFYRSEHDSRHANFTLLPNR